MKRLTPYLFIVSLMVVSLVGCTGKSNEPAVATPSAAAIDPANFVALIDNPFMPLIPGATRIYEGETEDGIERVEVTTLDETKLVMGVAVTVVRDTVYLDGILVEDTHDWFAQDKEGNVWYFGEEVDNYEDGILVDHHGAWAAGVDGAVPGIVMFAHPADHMGEPYHQEYYAGEAEDMGEVMSVSETVAVPFGTFADAVRTKDWTPLEPDTLEHKFYATGVGLIKEVDVRSGETIELITIISE